MGPGYFPTLVGAILLLIGAHPQDPVSRLSLCRRRAHRLHHSESLWWPVTGNLRAGVRRGIGRRRQLREVGLAARRGRLRDGGGAFLLAAADAVSTLELGLSHGPPLWPKVLPSSASPWYWPVSSSASSAPSTREGRGKALRGTRPAWGGHRLLLRHPAGHRVDHRIGS